MKQRQCNKQYKTHNPEGVRSKIQTIETKPLFECHSGLHDCLKPQIMKSRSESLWNCGDRGCQRKAEASVQKHHLPNDLVFTF